MSERIQMSLFGHQMSMQNYADMEMGISFSINRSAIIRNGFIGLDKGTTEREFWFPGLHHSSKCRGGSREVGGSCAMPDDLFPLE